MQPLKTILLNGKAKMYRILHPTTTDPTTTKKQPHKPTSNSSSPHPHSQRLQDLRQELHSLLDRRSVRVESKQIQELEAALHKAIKEWKRARCYTNRVEVVRCEQECARAAEVRRTREKRIGELEEEIRCLEERGEVETLGNGDGD